MKLAKNIKKLIFEQKHFYIMQYFINYLLFKGALSALRQFLAIKSPLKIKAIFILKISNFLSLLFVHEEKQLN